MPEFRGQGHGMEVWRAGISHAGHRSIGLDGVPDQQANYARSGFELTGSSVRFQGRTVKGSDPRVRPAEPSDTKHLIDLDLRATGLSRRSFANAWLSQAATRVTHVLSGETGLMGFATFRQCREGTKVGPLYATSPLAQIRSRPVHVRHGAQKLFVCQGTRHRGTRKCSRIHPVLSQRPGLYGNRAHVGRVGIVSGIGGRIHSSANGWVLVSRGRVGPNTFRSTDGYGDNFFVSCCPKAAVETVGSAIFRKTVGTVFGTPCVREVATVIDRRDDKNCFLPGKKCVTKNSSV